MLLVVSALLHALVLGLTPRWRHPFVARPTRLTATLVALAPLRPTSRSAQSPIPQKKIRAAPRRVRPPPPLFHATRATAAPVPLISTERIAPLARPSTIPVPSPAAAITGTRQRTDSGRAMGSFTEAAPAEATSPSKGPRTSLPPVDPPRSATLYYDVVAKDPRHDPNQTLIGKGVMHWAIEQNHYTLDLSATLKLLFVSIKVLESHSEGEIDKRGLEPLRYIETPRNRQSLVTVFGRGSPGAGASATESRTLPAGVQDRLSVVLQLGALLRANPALTLTTAQFDVPVAGLRGGVGTWTFFVFGDEEVATPLGTIRAVHLLRLMRRDTNDRELELWIALDRGGYPVRIRYTEPNESYIELGLTKIQ